MKLRFLITPLIIVTSYTQEGRSQDSICYAQIALDHLAKEYLPKKDKWLVIFDEKISDRYSGLAPFFRQTCLDTTTEFSVKVEYYAQSESTADGYVGCEQLKLNFKSKKRKSLFHRKKENTIEVFRPVKIDDNVFLSIGLHHKNGMRRCDYLINSSGKIIAWCGDGGYVY